MVVNTKLTIDGTEYTDSESIYVEKSISSNNATSNFSIRFDNHNGRFKDTFNLNDEVIIYADKNTTAVTKIFTGIIETLNFDGKQNKEKLVIKGRDYGAIIQDTNIDPTVYRNQEVSIIVKDIMKSYVENITVNNVNSTGIDLERITFNHTNIFDSFIQLAEYANFYFYIDEDKDLHFEEKEATSSGLNIDDQITNSSFKTDDSEVYNEVWAYGERSLTGANNRFTANGAGSVFTLDDRPSNTNVFLDDELQSTGGIYEMDNPANVFGLKYLVDYDRKQVIFVSGAAAGDNIPISGQTISIDYDRGKPVVANINDSTSISTYGHKEKILVNRNIQTYSEVSEYASSFLSEHKDPKIEGKITINGVVNVTPGQTLTLSVPNQNIVSQTYEIINAKYEFNKVNNLSDNVLVLKLNKLISNISDTLKSLVLKQKELETAGLQGSLTTLRELDDTTTVQSHYEVYSMSGTYFPFRFNVPGANILNSPHAVLGPWGLGSSLLQSGGTY